MILTNARRLGTFQRVVDRGLCIGCGVCAVVMPPGSVHLEHVPFEGIRPRFAKATMGVQSRFVSICPGAKLATRDYGGGGDELIIGPTRGIWRGYSADSEMRRTASSGGVVTALASYALAEGLVTAVLHTAADPAKPWKTRTVVSRTRQELLSRSGSRYSPSSPCEALPLIAQSNERWLFIGKPCDVAAARALAHIRPSLNRNLRFTVSFFCAGTPHAEATLELVREMGVSPNNVESIRYRGDGWPGDFVVVEKSGQEHRLSYAYAWRRLSRCRTLRCHLCPDGLGEIADVSCGDAWDVGGSTDNPGVSYVLARTMTGRQLVEGALAAGAILARPATSGDVVSAQLLVERRRQLFGRLLAMRAMGMSCPRYQGFRLLRAWLSGSLKMKVGSVLGTVHRRHKYRGSSRSVKE